MGLIWVTARQQRSALPAALVVIAAYVTSLVADESAADAVRRYGVDPSQVGILVVLSLGVFWAAPLLARDQQTGTVELVYTQSISRARWLTARITPPLLAAVVAPLVVLGLRAFVVPGFRSGYSRGIFGDAPTIVGIELFAVALGLLAGAVLRRIVPAMVVTALGFYAAESLVVPTAQKLIPMHKTSIDPSRLGSQVGMDRMPSRVPGHRQVYEYYTNAQLWGLQWLQLGLCVAVAAVLVAGAYYWMTRRVPRS